VNNINHSINFIITNLNKPIITKMEKEATTQENKDWAEMSDGEEPEADNNE
jgi:hypothetical protein